MKPWDPTIVLLIAVPAAVATFLFIAGVIALLDCFLSGDRRYDL